MTRQVSPSTPFTVCFHDGAAYRVAWVRNGKDREAPVGPAFDSPRDAVRYAERLERRAAQEAA